MQVLFRPLSAAAAATSTALCALLLMATSGAAAAEVPIAKPLHAAPEPAVSPPAGAQLPGVVLALAGKPEGVAIDTRGHVAVNVRNPDGLVWFQESSPTVRHFVATGGTARHLTLGASKSLMLVPDESDDRLVEISLPSGATVANVAVGRQPHDAIAVGASTVFVADELANTIHIVRSGRVVRVVQAPLQPGGMAANPAGTRALVVGVRGRRIVEYTSSGDVIGAANCGAGPTHAVTGNDGRYWVADTNGGAILGFEMGRHGPVQVATIPVGPRPYGLAFDARTNTIWVTITGDDELLGLKMDGSSVVQTTRFATIRQPNTVAVDPVSGEVVVAGATKDGALQIINGTGAVHADG